MKSKSQPVWNNMKQASELDSRINRLKECFEQVPEAIRHLKKVTGKVGISNISPLDEKRWSAKCLSHWLLLSEISIFIETGKTPNDQIESYLKEFKPLDVPFVGRHKTAIKDE